MIDQFRGKNKNRFTGGSQFRAKPTKDNGPDRSAELNSLRQSLKSLRGEMKTMKIEFGEMESCVESDRQARYLVEEELRKEHMKTINLKHELDKLNNLLEKQVGQPKINMEPTGMDLQMLEARLKEAMKQTDNLRENKNTIVKELKTKNEEIKELGQRREAEKKRWEEERSRLYEEIDRWRQRSKESLSALESTEAKNKKETSKIEDKLRRMSKQASEKTKGELKKKETELKKLAEEAEALRSSHDKYIELEKEHKLERRNSQAVLTKLEGLKEELARKSSMGEQGKIDMDNAEEKIRKLNEEIVDLREILDTDEAQIKILRKEIEQLKDNKDVEKERINLVQKLKETADELRTVSEEKKEMMEKYHAKIEEFNILEAKAARDRRNHTNNMEQALNSIVRLCVVAPTVNVQMAEDKSMSFKAPLPREKIRHFVQDQVLPKFAKIFAQPKDGCAPDGKNSLDTWLQKVLVEMQHTIEKHLSKVFGK